MILISRFYLPLFVLFFLLFPLFPSACLSSASATEMPHVTDAGSYGFNFHNAGFHRVATNQVYIQAKKRLAAARSAPPATMNVGAEAEDALESAMAHLKVSAESQQSEFADVPPIDIHIFDAGCGDGSFANALLAHYPKEADFRLHYTGADVREGYSFIKAINEAQKQKNPPSGHTFSSAPKGDGNFLLYLDNPELAGTLDVVSAMMVLHYVAPWNLPHALNAIHHAMKDDGIFVGTVKQEKPSVRAHLKYGPDSSLFPTYTNIIDGDETTRNIFFIKSMNLGDRKDGLIVNAYTPESLKALLETFGFDVQLCMTFEDMIDHPQAKDYSFEYVGFVAKKRQKANPKDAQTSEEQLDAEIMKVRLEQYNAEGKSLQHKFFKLFEDMMWPLPAEWHDIAYMRTDKRNRDRERQHRRAHS